VGEEFFDVGGISRNESLLGDRLKNKAQVWETIKPMKDMTLMSQGQMAAV
jgi:hypothetical protein